MAYTVNWLAQEITIPAADLELISGSYYRLDMTLFHKEIRRLEWEFTEGMAWPQVLDHTNPKTIAGTTYFPFDEIINGYTVQFEAGIERVDLTGSNNNLVDVLVYTGVSVVPSNSAGGQTIDGGGTYSAVDRARDNQTALDASAVRGKEGIDVNGNYLVYDANGNLLAKKLRTGGTVPTNVPMELTPE